MTLPLINRQHKSSSARRGGPPMAQFPDEMGSRTHSTNVLLQQNCRSYAASMRVTHLRFVSLFTHLLFLSSISTSSHLDERRPARCIFSRNTVVDRRVLHTLVLSGCLLVHLHGGFHAARCTIFSFVPSARARATNITSLTRPRNNYLPVCLYNSDACTFMTAALVLLASLHTGNG